MTRTMSEITISPAARAKVAIIVTSLALLAFIYFAARLIEHAKAPRFVIPDEKAAAAALLEHTLRGPQYFERHPLPSRFDHASASPASGGSILISVSDAQAQLPRVAAARHFDSAQTARLSELIERLAEPSASRVVGEPAVDLLRLNLALDQLR